MAFTKVDCQELASRCMKAKSLRGVLRVVRNWLANMQTRGAWYYQIVRFADWLKSGKTAFSVFSIDGNSKLPFAAFSTLPGFTCPGAGDCLEWCYSFRAWRYPAAFLRQLQNSLLLKFCPEIVASRFQELANGLTVRLYVDGDFDSLQTVKFWMAEIASRPDLDVYGYSKSWEELLAFDGVWPPNYVLNVSSGSKWSDTHRDAILALPITRGVFEAVEINMTDLPNGFARYESSEYHNRVRTAYREQTGLKAISCPGKCGSCGFAKHHCGNSKTIVPIAIGIHRGKK